MPIQFLLPELATDRRQGRAERPGNNQAKTYRGKYKASDEKYPRSRFEHLRGTWTLTWANTKRIFRRNRRGDLGNDDKKTRDDDSKAPEPSRVGAAQDVDSEIVWSLPSPIDPRLNSLFGSCHHQYQLRPELLSLSQPGLTGTPLPFCNLSRDRSELDYLRRTNAEEWQRSLAARRSRLHSLSRETWTQEIKGNSYSPPIGWYTMEAIEGLGISYEDVRDSEESEGKEYDEDSEGKKDYQEWIGVVQWGDVPYSAPGDSGR